MMRLATVLSFIIATVGIVLLIICVSTDYWVSRKRGLVEVNEGLWYVCRKAKASTKPAECARLFETFSEASGKLVAVIVLLFLACAFHLMNAAVSFALWFYGKSLANFICVMQALTLTSAMAGLSTYVKYYNNRYYRLDWSYIVGWIGVSALFVGLVFMIVGIERKRSTVV